MKNFPILPLLAHFFSTHLFHRPSLLLRHSSPSPTLPHHPRSSSNLPTMFPTDRSNFTRRRPPGFPSGFPQFPDPFAGFGMNGGNSLLHEFFGRDPFDDPFFSAPFGGVFGPPGGLFGGNGFLGHAGFFGGGGMLGRPDGGFLEQRPFNPPQPEGRRGPVIEELPDDDEAPEDQPSRSEEPIIEHPDDEFSPVVETASRARNHTREVQQGQSLPARSNNRFQNHSFSSSTVTYGGLGGMYSYSSSTRKVGPDGVTEEVHTKQDSTTGTETTSVACGFGEKVHAVTRKRNASGREETVETLHNLTEEEVANFDKKWEKHAERSLPDINRSHQQMLKGQHSGSSSRSRLALPSNEGFNDECQPPKKLPKN